MRLLRRLAEVYANEGLLGLRRRLVGRLGGAAPVAPRTLEPILLQLDHPRQDRAVSDRLWVGGWAVAPSGIADIQIALDEVPLGRVHLGISRPDLAALYPEFEGAWQSGFTFPLDTTAAEDGQHELTLTVTSGTGRREAFIYPVEIDNSLSDYQRWLAAHAAEHVEDPAPPDDLGIAFVISRPGDASETADDPGAEATYLMVLGAGDQLAPHALARLAACARAHDLPDLIYGDEDRIEADGRRHSPAFKPGWSPTLLQATNYIGRPWAVRAERLEALGLTWPPRDEHDFLLRLAETNPSVGHLDDILCSRAEPGPPPGDRPARPVLARPPKVSVIVPTKAGSDLIRECLSALVAKTGYQNLELILLANPDPSDDQARAFLADFPAKQLEMTGPFNWSGYNNQGAAASSGEVLLFANDDLEPIAEDWVEALLEHALKPEVGPVGAKLLYGDQRVQHCGMFLVEEGGGNRHAFRFLERDDPGYLGLASLAREVIAVTGACLMVERAKFERLGGFDERLALTHNDLDFCLRAHEAGLSSVVTPHALLYHHERVTRRTMPEDADTALFRERWRALYRRGDPYHNANLAKDRDDYAIAAPAVSKP